MEDLAEAVSGFIEEISEHLEGRQAFHARVARNALAIVAREARQRPREAELAYYQERTGCADDAAPDAEFAAAIRNGRIDTDDPEMLKSMTRFVAARLAVDNPKFSTLAILRELDA